MPQWQTLARSEGRTPRAPLLGAPDTAQTAAIAGRMLEAIMWSHVTVHSAHCVAVCGPPLKPLGFKIHVQTFRYVRAALIVLGLSS